MSYPDEKAMVHLVDTLGRQLFEVYLAKPESKPEEAVADPRLAEGFNALFPLLLTLVDQQKEYLPQLAAQFFLQRLPEQDNKRLSMFLIDAVQAACQFYLKGNKQPGLTREERIAFELKPGAALATRGEMALKQEEQAVPAASALTAQAGFGVREKPGGEAEVVSLDEAAVAEAEGEATKATENNVEAETTTVVAAVEAAQEDRDPDFRLLRLMSWSFPQETVLLNWPFRSHLFDAYLPRLRLAIKLGEPPKAPSRTGLWLKKEKITVVWIPKSLLEEPLRLRSQLKGAVGKAGHQGIAFFQKQEDSPAPAECVEESRGREEAS